MLTCDLGSTVQHWSAQHDGYRRLTTPSVHRRAVTLDSVRRRLVVVDSFTAASPVPAMLTWHLGPEIEVELTDGESTGGVAIVSWHVDDEQRSGVVQLPAQLQWSVHRGELDPIQGWYSPAFGARVPAAVLVGRGAIDAGTRLITEFELP